MKKFLDRKGVSLSPKVYFVDAMGSMALGLFASLLMGTILSTIATYTGWSILSEAAGYASGATGIILGIAIANSLKAPLLVLYSAGVVGMAGYSMGSAFLIGGEEKLLTAGPAGAFFAVIVAAEIGKLVSKETNIDILVTPSVTILSGVLFCKLICPAVSYAMYYIGWFINYATEMQPIVMGILISVAVGVALTLPISSAAICAMIGISGLAGGAATVGCCAQMVGFAVISFRENRVGGLVAQGLGTSMLQMGNLTKNPRLWIPPTLTAAILGPISTTLFKLENAGVSAGMGTCGLVGPLGVISATPNSAMKWVGVFLLLFVAPAVLSLIFSEIMRKIGWIKENDLKLDL
ncbi:MAG: PTS sugar transporter subunit IIC [Clostridia bacterium]|nr:PTS sugar transporter subunit IIC [Clostridia bacterium]